MFDMVSSTLLLPLLFFPMMALVFLIHLIQRAALFFQERIGKGGRKFRCYKFRTMYADAEERLKVVLKNDPLNGMSGRTYGSSRMIRGSPA